MKSAYELAMERLERESGPTKKLTEEQKAAIADIEKRYEAKAAELKLSYDAKLASAASLDELNALKGELAEKTQDLEAQREREKDAIWNQS